MDETSLITFDLSSSDPAAPISIAVWVDETCVFETQHLDSSHRFEHRINDTEADHVLRVVMTGKQSYHTKLDEDGNIVEDVVININNVEIDGIDITHVFYEKTVYNHSFNGTQPEIQDQFFGIMGCNGQVSLSFSTPMYLWLLENM